VSLTVTVNEHDVEFGGVAASLTEQVTVVTPLANVLPEAGVHTGVPTPGQLSAAAGVAYVTTAVHRFGSVAFVMLAGQVIVGACISFTVTVKLQLELLPDASLTEQLTVVMPLANVAPEAGLHVGAPTPGQLSLTAGAAKLTAAEQTFGSVAVVMFAGQVIEGGCVSFTVTVKLHEEVFGGVAASLTEQVTVVVPLANAVPLGGTHVTAPTPGQL